jgi:hypothetical protein
LRHHYEVHFEATGIRSKVDLRNDALHISPKPWSDGDLTPSGLPFVNGFVYRPVEDMTHSKAGGKTPQDGESSSEAS